MLGEDQVRVAWKSGNFEQNAACHTCGDKNAWGQVHQCCQTHCQSTLNALQAFAYAEWDDISAAPLDPVKVAAARKLEVSYAGNKPV